MKKILINSSFILVVILFVFSAFISRKKERPFAVAYHIWGIISTISNNPTFSDIQAASRLMLAGQITNPLDFDGGGGYTAIQYSNQLNYAYNLQLTTTEEPFMYFDGTTGKSGLNVRCSENSSRTCIAYTRVDSEGEDSVLAVMTGAYEEIEEVE